MADEAEDMIIVELDMVRGVDVGMNIVMDIVDAVAMVMIVEVDLGKTMEDPGSMIVNIDRISNRDLRRIWDRR